MVTNNNDAAKRDIPRRTKWDKYYLYNDYQGSLIAAQKKGSTVLEQFSLDPWGRRRDGLNWLDYETTNSPFTALYKRGYTGHEHIDAFGLINMNGRMYDARLGRFLSPDPGACPVRKGCRHPVTPRATTGIAIYGIIR